MGFVIFLCVYVMSYIVIVFVNVEKCYIVYCSDLLLSCLMLEMVLWNLYLCVYLLIEDEFKGEVVCLYCGLVFVFVD